MEQPNQGLSSSLTNKRKRGRPRRDESQTQQQMNPPPLTSTDENMIGQVVSGVVEGSFEAGYFLNVKVADTDKQLRGVVFFPEKVTPVTPATDLFPQARMYAREHIPVPSLNQRTLPQTDNLNADKNLSATLPNNHPMSHAGVGTEAINERNLPIDTHMQDVGGSSAVEKLTEPEGQTLSLMPQFASDATPKEVHTVLRSEACAATPEASRKLAVGSSSTLRFELFQNETKRSGTEEVKSPADVEPRGVEEKLASPVDDVPEELQLELGNKKLSASAIAPEANPDHSASSKSGFLTNLFEGREETAKEPEGPNAASKSGFPETTTEVDDNES
ncbi:Protein METABOLIC NETWORK MODULATOR 1 [Cardamine amara subsp. amara]|uniref:Protein METABOLIC NETWORK MODULATOR 1 n=1 Tax=Cardamine amara subsp. amara TaxID=228776 RepID=A0ABD1AJB7_CARAN